MGKILFQCPRTTPGEVLADTFPAVDLRAVAFRAAFLAGQAWRRFQPRDDKASLVPSFPPAKCDGLQTQILASSTHLLLTFQPRTYSFLLDFSSLIRSCNTHV